MSGRSIDWEELLRTMPEMSDSTVDWAKLLRIIPNTEQVPYSAPNEQTNNPHEKAETYKTEILSSSLKHQNLWTKVHRSSSCQIPSLDSYVQSFLLDRGCLMNPVGIFYEQQMPGPPKPLESNVLGLLGLPQINLCIEQEGKKRIIEGSEDVERRQEMKRIKNRASAARSRVKKLEHIRLLEEQVEALRGENAYLKNIIKLEMEQGHKYVNMQTKDDKTESKLRELGRTLNLPW